MGAQEECETFETGSSPAKYWALKDTSVNVLSALEQYLVHLGGGGAAGLAARAPSRNNSQLFIVHRAWPYDVLRIRYLPSVVSEVRNTYIHIYI